MNRPLLSVGLALLTIPLVASTRAQNPATDPYSVLGVPAKSGARLEVRLLWLPHTGWIPEGGFALYRAKNGGALAKVATLKPDPALLPADVSAKARVGAATARLTERTVRPASSLAAFRDFKQAMEAPSPGKPLAFVRREAAALPSVRLLEPVRKPLPLGLKAAPTPAALAAALRSQIALTALTDRSRAKSLALGYDDADVDEGQSIRYELRGIDASGAEQPKALGSTTVVVRAAEAVPTLPDAATFAAVQLDQDSAALHWERPGVEEAKKLVLPRYDVYRDEKKINSDPILLTSHEVAGGGEASSLLSFQEDKLSLGPHIWKLTLTDAFGRVSAPVFTTMTMADLRVPAPMGVVRGNFEVDTILSRPGLARSFVVRLYWAAPLDARPVVFDITRIDAGAPTSRTSLTGTTPIPGNSAGAGNMTLHDLAYLTGDSSLVSDIFSATTLDQARQLLPNVAIKSLGQVGDPGKPSLADQLRAVLSATIVGAADSMYPALQSRIDALAARIRTTTDDGAPPDRFYRYEMTASYGATGARHTLATLSAPVGVPLLVQPGTPIPTGTWTRNTFFDAGTLTQAGSYRNTAPVSAGGVIPKRPASASSKFSAPSIKAIPEKLGGTVALSWNAVPQTIQMRYRIFRAVATGYFPEGVSIGQAGTGIGKHFTATGGTKKRVYYTQYNGLKDSDYQILGSTDKTSWTDSLPPSQHCVYLYKVEAVNRWSIAGKRSIPLVVTVGATLPPSSPTLTSVKAKNVVNVDGALQLTFSPNPTEERVTEYRVLRMLAPGQAQVTMVAPSVHVASLGGAPPSAPGLAKPHVSQLVGGKQLAPDGPEARRVGFPSARFGVVHSMGALHAIQKQKIVALSTQLAGITSYAEVGKVTVAVGASPVSLTFLDSTAKPGNEYFYKLVAVNDEAIGSFGSNVIDGRPFTKTLKPMSGSATWDRPNRTVKLTWSAVPGAGGYFVRRQLGAGPALQLGALTTMAFDDPDARAGRTYTYLVYASDKAGGLSDPLALTVTTDAETEALPPGPTRTAPKPVPPKTNPGENLGAPTFGQPILLENNLQLNVLSMKYTVEPHADYDGTMAQPDQKLVWITFSVKNLEKEGTRQFGGFDVTVLDDAGNGYTGGSTENSTSRQSTGNKAFFVTMQPGQSIGDDPAKDELSAAIIVPFGAKIVKLQLNKSLVTAKGEKITYELAGKNAISPLPAYAATNPGVAEPGKFYPDGYFAIRFENLMFTEQPVYEKAPLEPGMRYAVATFTAKNIFTKKIGTFDLYAGQSDTIFVSDIVGNKYKVTGDPGYAFRHPKNDALLEGQELDLNDEVKYRYIFQVPKSAKLASITFGQNRYGHIYKLNLEKN